MNPASILDILAQRPEPTGSYAQAAAVAAQQLPLPGRHLERWKYTDLSTLTGEPLSIADPQPATPVPVAPDTAGHFVAISNGRLDTAASSADNSAGLSVNEVAVAAGDPAFADAFDALSAACVETEVEIRVAESTHLSHPVHVRIWHATDPGRVVLPRVVVTVGAGASVSIVEEHLGDSDSAATLNAPRIRFDVAAGAAVNHCRVQAEPVDTTHIASSRINLGVGATFKSVDLELGAGIARHDVAAPLAAADATLKLDGIYLVNARRHTDVYVTADHRVANTTSRLNVRGIVADRASAAFSGHVRVQPDAQKTDSQQSNNNLLLSLQADVNTRPVLEIHADDVKCAHGATIGQLDEAAVFFLRSRGIPAAEARRMLVAGFAEDVLAAVIGDHSRTIAERHLHDALAAVDLDTPTL